MYQSNPLIPSGSILEQKRRRKAKVLYTVFVIAAIHVVPISGLLLMQGCKRDQPMASRNSEDVIAEETLPRLDTNRLYEENVSDTSGLTVPLDGNQASQKQEAEKSPIAPTPAPELAGLEPKEPKEPEKARLDAVANPPSVETEPRSESREYTIRPGDRLYTLAKSHRTSVHAILDANPGLHPRRLRIGQRIVIPAGAVETESFKAEEPDDGSKIYVVRPGDTLIGIAKRNGINLGSLRKANALRTDRILVGQKLKIPVAKMAAASG